MTYLIDEVPGAEYQSLEQLQQSIFMQLARLVVEAIRQDRPRGEPRAGELATGSKYDTIEPKELLEVNDDV